MITLINGNVQSPAGLVVPDGSISFQLNVDATVIAAPYGIVLASEPVSFQFDANGNLQSGAQIYSNAELEPQNSNGLGTYYLVTFYDANGARINKNVMWWQFPEAANSTVDISSMTPYAVGGGNIIFYPTRPGGGGSVDAVAFAGDGIVLVSTPSAPVTSIGTLQATLLTQGANLILAGPTGGGPALPTFRTLVAADLPSSANFSLNGSTQSVSLVAGNNITLLSNASTISIVGVAASGAAVNALGAGTSTSTGSISLSAGAGIQISSSGASIISIGTTGTNFNALIPAGNTTGTAQTYTGSVTMVAVSPLLFSMAATNQSLTIAGPAYSAASPLAVSTTNGIVSYAGPLYAAGGGLLLSTTGGTISYSQTSVNVVSSLNGSTGALSLSAGAGIGIGQANSTITFSASVQTITQSLTGVGNTTLSSTATFSGLLNISGAGIVSVGMSGNELTISATTSVQTSSVSLTASGNTITNTTGTFSNALVFSGAGIASVGFSGNSITISATTPNVTNFSTISLSGVGNTTNSASGTLNNVLSVSGAGIISVGISNNNLTISATTPSITNFSTVSLTVLGNTTSSSSGTFNNLLNVSGAGAISVGAGAGSLTISGTNYSINGTNTNSVSISAGAGIGIGQAANTITVSASVQTFSQSLTALGVTTSSSAGTFSGLLNVSGAGIVSVGVGNGSITISATTAASAAVQSVVSMSGNTSGTASAISTGTFYLQAISPMVLSQSTTVGTGSTTSNILSILAPAFSAGAGLAVSTTGGTISYSASVQTSSISLTASGANTFSSSTGTYSNVLVFSGMGGASVGMSANSVSISVPAAIASGILYASATSIAGGATAGTVTSAPINSTLSLIAGSGITIGQGSNDAFTFSGNTAAQLSAGTGISISQVGSIITISTTGSVVNGFGISSITAGGGTSGTTTTASGQILLAAGSNITLSSSAGGITLIGGAGGAAGTQSLQAGTGTVSGTAVSLNIQAGNNVTLSTSSAAGALSVTIGDQPAKVSFTQNMNLQDVGGQVAGATGTVTGTAGFGSSLFLQRVFIPSAMTVTEADLAMGMSFNATSNGAGTMSQSWVLYSFGNSSSLASVISTSSTYAWSTGTSTTAGAASLTQFQGGWSVQKIHPMTFGSSTVPAGEYVIGNLINFAQASSTWTVALLGQLGSITNSTTLSNVTTTGQTTFAGLSNAGTGAFTAISLSRTSAYARIQTSTSSSQTIALTAFSGAPIAASITAFSAAPTSVTGLSSVALSTQSIVPQYLTVPNLVYIGTGSTTSALPSVFLAGIMSTGGIPAAITLSSTAITYWGTAAGAQPYFALIGS